MIIIIIVNLLTNEVDIRIGLNIAIISLIDILVLRLSML